MPSFEDVLEPIAPAPYEKYLEPVETTPTGLATTPTPGPEEMVDFGGYSVPKSRVVDYATKHGITPEQTMYLGTRAGQIDAKFSKTALGQTLGQVGLGLNDLATAGLSLAGRAGILDVDSEKLHQDKAHQEAFQKLVEEGGDIDSALGETGSQIYNGVVRNTGKMAAAGAGGAVALYSSMGGETFDSSLQEAQNHDLKGTDALLYAGKKTGVQLATTFLMGRAMQKLGVRTLEESIAPTTQREAGRLVEKLGLGPKITTLVKSMAGMGAEGTMNSAQDAIGQYIELGDGVRKDFDVAQTLQAGAVGALSAGAYSAIEGISHALTKAQPEIESRVKGMLDGEKLVKDVSSEDAQDLSLATDAELRQKIGEPNADPAHLDSVRDQIKDRVTQDTEAQAAKQEILGGNGSPDNSTEAAKLATSVFSTADPVQAVPTPSDAGVAVQGGTTARHADLFRDAQALGLDTYFSPGVKHVSEMQSEARRLGIPDRAVEIARDSLKTKRTLTEVEQEGLKIKFAEQKRQSSELARRLVEATDEADVRSMGASLNRHSDEAQAIHDALAVAGTEAGRKLVYRKFGVDGDDFSPVSVIARAMSAAHASLDPAVKSEFNKLAGEHESIQAKHDAKEAEVLGKQAHKILEETNAQDSGESDIGSLYKRVIELFKGGCDF